MITKEELTKIYQDKLAKTGSFDEAFLKAIWCAYKAGLADGKAEGNKHG